MNDSSRTLTRMTSNNAKKKPRLKNIIIFFSSSGCSPTDVHHMPTIKRMIFSAHLKTDFDYLALISETVFAQLLLFVCLLGVKGAPTTVNLRPSLNFSLLVTT